MGVRVVGVQLNGFLKVGDRFFVFPNIVICVANDHVGHRARFFTLEFERLRELRDGFRVTALGSVCESEISKGVGIIGLDFNALC